MRNISPIKASGLFFAAMFLILMTEPSLALQDGQARTPPMGWNDWYFYEKLIDESIVLGTIGAFTKKHAANWEGKQISLKDAGYSYFCIDDCWGNGSRTAQGKLQISAIKFPRSAGTNSFKWLGDSLHSLGLKFGIYTSDGTFACQQTQPGACDHEDSDAAQFASWGVDFIKDDCCFSESCPSRSKFESGLPGDNKNNHYLYVRMRDAIKKTGRPMLLSLCDYGKSLPWLYGDTVGHLWRTNHDFGGADWGNFISHVDQNQTNAVWKYAKPGSWNDPDILLVGMGSLTTEENRSHFSLWCIMAAPLLLGNNLITMSEETFSIISNREAIAVNQDSLGVEGRRVRQTGNVDIFVKKMKSIDTTNNRKFAVVLLNRNTGPAVAAVKWSDIGETNSKAAYIVRDLWKHVYGAAPATDSVRVTLPGHGCAFLMLTKGTDTVAVETPVSRKNPLNRLASRRCASRGIEVFIPDANSLVQIFNAQGKMTASFSVPRPSWCRINDKVSLQGICMVRVKTSSGMLVEKLLPAR